MSKTKIIIQARTGSTRLPQKMILPFYENEGIFSLLLKKLTITFDKNDIILATSVNENNDVLVEIAERYGFTESKVKMLSVRTREKLGKLLKKEELI